MRIFALFSLILVSLFALPVAAQADKKACATPQPISIGQNVHTRPGLIVRNLPTLSGGQVGYWARSVTFHVVGGPVCADGYNWWQVETPGNSGWAAEGKPDFLLLFPDSHYRDDLGCPAPLSLAKDSRVIMSSAPILHNEPALLSGRVGPTPQGATGFITDGPVCNDGMNWWQVRVSLGNREYSTGWLPENFDEKPVFAADSPSVGVCAPAYRRLGQGIRAVVTYRNHQPKNLRTAPGTGNAVVTQLLDGVAVDVIGGSVCADGYNWWQVQVVANPELSGWMAEGGTGAGGYWLMPIQNVLDDY